MVEKKIDNSKEKHKIINNLWFSEDKKDSFENEEEELNQNSHLP